MVMTDDKIEELTMRFQGIWESMQRVEALKEQEKAFTGSIRECIKELSETMETTQKAVKQGLKEYIESKKEPGQSEEKNEVFALLQEHDLLKLEKMND